VELNELTAENAPAGCGSSPAVSGFRYYIHDHSHVFRLQLVGSIGEIDIAELDGCWRTANGAIAERKVCIDLRKVTGTDAAVRAWLSKMAHRDGVEFLASFHLVSELPEGSVVHLEAPEILPTGRWRRFVRRLSRMRRRSISRETATACVRGPLAMRSSETQIPAA
jgi:hypothetical protein